MLLNPFLRSCRTSYAVKLNKYKVRINLALKKNGSVQLNPATAADAFHDGAMGCRLLI